jgi:cyclopentanol dehydrogenase
MHLINVSAILFCIKNPFLSIFLTRQSYCLWQREQDLLHHVFNRKLIQGRSIMGTFEGRVVIVTGAGQGIGYAITRKFALEGAVVIATGRTLSKVERTSRELAPLKVVPFGMDCGKEEDWLKLTAFVEGEYGRLDVLVNIAGIEMGKDILHMTIDEFRAEESCNLESVFLGMKHCHDLLLKGENPNIINISSIAARKSGPSCGNDAGYSATKAAVCLLSRHAAYTYAPEGIRVNAILPGGVKTAIVERDLAGMENAEAFLSALNPLPPHLADPDDIAEIAWFVGAKGAFMTGSEIVADGGNLTH